MNAKIYFDGRLARLRGKSERDVPYFEGTDQYHDWITGFYDVEDDEMRINPADENEPLQLILQDGLPLSRLVATLQLWGFEFDQGLMGESIGYYDTLVYAPGEQDESLVISTKLKKMCMWQEEN